MQNPVYLLNKFDTVLQKNKKGLSFIVKNDELLCHLHHIHL